MTPKYTRPATPTTATTHQSTDSMGSISLRVGCAVCAMPRSLATPTSSNLWGRRRNDADRPTPVAPASQRLDGSVSITPGRHGHLCVGAIEAVRATRADIQLRRYAATEQIECMTNALVAEDVQLAHVDEGGGEAGEFPQPRRRRECTHAFAAPVRTKQRVPAGEVVVIAHRRIRHDLGIRFDGPIIEHRIDQNLPCK